MQAAYALFLGGMESLAQGNPLNPAQPMAETLIKSKQRVTEYGEVLTPSYLVEAMLNLVQSETERIDSRFLEPACGTGNFLVAVLRRKLEVVKKRYRRIQLDYERYAVLAVSSLYGIDILADNVQECRQRLYQTFAGEYEALFRKKCKERCYAVVRYILERNIIHGDALLLRTVGPNPQPIIFSEWSLVGGTFLKRRDFAFEELLRDPGGSPSLFEAGQTLLSDTGQKVFIPRPVKDYPPVPFLEVAQAYGF